MGPLQDRELSRGAELALGDPFGRRKPRLPAGSGGGEGRWEGLGGEGTGAAVAEGDSAEGVADGKPFVAAACEREWIATDFVEPQAVTASTRIASSAAARCLLEISMRPISSSRIDWKAS